MANAEVLPLAPDTEVRHGRRVLTEPTEVGAFLDGTVFVKLTDVAVNAALDVDVLISPYGYEDEEHWAVGESVSALDAEQMYSIPVSHFGNFLRLALVVEGNSGDEVELQAWFVGKG